VRDSLRLHRTGAGKPGTMSEDERLIEDAERSLRETEKLRNSGLPDEQEDEPSEGEPGAKTSSGDADSIVEDD
jgi:hypothetical protein